MKNLLCSLLCVLSILYASAAAAENLTGEVTIDGVSFVLNAAVLNPETDVAARYTVTGRKWGDEPRDTFDIGLFLKNPEAAEITYRGQYGEREYSVGETFNRRFDESLRFDVYGLQYQTFFGRGRSGEKRFSYSDSPERIENAYGKQVFENVYRARNPQPGDVPDLEGITYAQALAAIESYRYAFPGGVAIGEPYYVEAWSSENVLAFERSFGDDLLQSEIDEILAGPDYYIIYLRTYITNAPGLRGFASLTEWRPSTFDDRTYRSTRSARWRSSAQTAWSASGWSPMSPISSARASSPPSSARKRPSSAYNRRRASSPSSTALPRTRGLYKTSLPSSKSRRSSS